MLKREILIQEDYLHIPVRPGLGDRYSLQVWLEGLMVREVYLSIDDQPDPTYFFMDVKKFAGKTLTLMLSEPGDLNPGVLEGVVPGSAAVRGHPLYPDLYHEKLRPQFHFSSKRGWLNDPNGLVYAGGQYHMYYQHNPMGTPHGGVNICWGHAVSQDLIHWTELDDAIQPWRRDWSVASGSALVDYDGDAGYGKSAIVAAFTALGTYNEIPGRHYDSGGQFMAASQDGGNTFYLFSTQATVPTENGEGWRDPRLFRYEDGYVMAVYETENDVNCITFYTSKNLRDWTRTSRNMDLYECPDVFKLMTLEGESRFVFYGADGRACIGEFDGKAFHESGENNPLDYGRAIYAGQTWSDEPQGKRLHISWIMGMDGIRCEESFPDMPFSQCMSIPCELTLQKFDGHFRVLRNPVESVKALREGAPEQLEQMITGRTMIPFDRPCDWEMSLHDIQGKLTITAGEHDIEYDPATRTLRFEGDKESAVTDEVLSIRLLTDTTMMEFFFGEGVAATYTIHPDDMSLILDGHAKVQYKKWSLRSVWAEELNGGDRF